MNREVHVRFWESAELGCSALLAYLRAYDSVAEARTSISRYLEFYNRKRPHSSLDARTPDQAYFRPPAATRGSMNIAAVGGASLRSGYALPAHRPTNGITG